jgi:hypothetical protein
MALKCPECAASGGGCLYGTARPQEDPAYGEWNRHQPLGRCDQCRRPTWNPVTWYSRSRLAAGRAGYYYCETCGPAMYELALVSGELLEDVHGLAPVPGDDR